MTDIQFDLFLEKSVKEYGNEYIDFSEDLNEFHTFSKKFEKKILKLVNLKKSKYFPNVKVPIRRFVVAMIMIIILMTMTLAISAARDAFFGFFAQIFDTHSEVRSINYDNSPLVIEEIYCISTPDGFELEYVDDINKNQSSITYVYKNGTKYIVFTQYVKSEYNVSVNTENKITKSFSVNNFSGFIVDIGNDEYYISWDNEDYVFDITGNIGKNALIEVVKTVEKVE